ncbi:MAG: AtpZ/AtpI family protein, partial [Pseudonocardiaceae bacterium]
MAEFISAILTWGGIGWLLDRWLHTKPWLVAVGFVIGIVAGFYLMYVRSHGMIATEPQPRGAGGSAPTNRGAGG